MTTEAKRAWIINAMFVGLLGLALFLKIGPSTVEAAGGGMETDGIMVATGGADEKLVVVNTETKQMMVYREVSPGIFRLLSARSYKFDQCVTTDTAGVKDIEGEGITASQAAARYAERNTAPQKKQP